MLFVYEQQGGVTLQELFAANGRTWSRFVSGEWYEMTGPAMESFGEELWNGSIVEGGTLTIPRANEYGVMAVSYSSHAPVGLAMHYRSTNGKHIISGIDGSSMANGLSIRGFDLRSDDGITWTLYDAAALGLWGSGTEIAGQWSSVATANTLTIWGIVPSQVTQRVLTS